MDSIQLIRLLDVLEVNTLQTAVGVVPRSIIVTGKDFRSVESVLIDSYEAPSFVVLSTTQILVEVPEALQEAIITSVTVLSTKVTFSERSLVEFTVGSIPRKVTGIQRLMQMFLRILLRSPGSNIFHPRSGGGLFKRVGGVINRNAAADITIAVNTTQQYIVAQQTPERNIPPSERLLAAEISSISVDEKATAAYVTVVLTNHAGVKAAATLFS